MEKVSHYLLTPTHAKSGEVSSSHKTFLELHGKTALPRSQDDLRSFYELHWWGVHTSAFSSATTASLKMNFCTLTGGVSGTNTHASARGGVTRVEMMIRHIIWLSQTLWEVSWLQGLFLNISFFSGIIFLSTSDSLTLWRRPLNISSPWLSINAHPSVPQAL